MPPPPSEPRTAFLSVTPLEPVLVFHTAKEAKAYQEYYNSMARIYPQQPDSVYLPLPDGLVSCRTARRGDVAFVFSSTCEAAAFGRASRVGRIYRSDVKPATARTVYVGMELI